MSQATSKSAVLDTLQRKRAERGIERDWSLKDAIGSWCRLAPPAPLANWQPWLRIDLRVEEHLPWLP